MIFLRSSLYSFSCIFIFLLVSTFLPSSQATVQWQDCGEPLSSQVPRFTVFDVLPNPIQVGQTAHAHAQVTLPNIAQGSITGGSITMEIRFNGATQFTIPDIFLCNSSSAIACSALGTGDNAISFDFEVPQIPEGNYELKLSFTPFPTQVKTGCLVFGVQVVDPSATNTYTSWISATLVGVAQFGTSDYASRQPEEPVQVGPIGPAAPTVSANYQWGTFVSVSGSQDLIANAFNPAGYVWGLSGSMNRLQTSQTVNKQTYSGDFYLGYVSSLSQRQLDSLIAEGNFTLTWTFTTVNGAVTSSLAGSFSFSDTAVLPTGWFAPVSLGRLGSYSLYTTSEGLLMVNSSSKYCITETPCAYADYNTAPDNGSLSSRDLALIVCLTAGLAVVAAAIVAAVFWARNRKHKQEEAGIFSAARKPEYGNALVIDDIIQESRDHADGVHYDQDSRDSSYYSDSNDDEETPRNRRNSRNARHSRSESDESDNDKSPLTPARRSAKLRRHSRSRSRSVSRSPSPTSLSRTPRSPHTRSSRSRSRTPPRTSKKGKGKARIESDYSEEDSYRARDKSGGEYSDVTAESRE